MSFDFFSEKFGGCPLFDNSPFYTPYNATRDTPALSSSKSSTLSSANGPSILQKQQEELQNEDHLLSAILALKSGDYAAARNIFSLIKPDTEPGLFTSEHIAYRSILERLLVEPAVAIYGTNIGNMAAILATCMHTSMAQTFNQVFDWYQAIEQAAKTGQRGPLTEKQVFEMRLVLNTFLHSVHLHGATLCYENTNYPVYRGNGPVTAQQPQEMQTYLSQVENFRQLAVKLGSISALKHFDLIDLTNDACRTGKINPSKAEQLMTKYSHDPLMRGRLAVLRADSILSPPWSSPVLLNLCPVLVVGTYKDSSLWTVLEDNMRLVDIRAARLLYDQAQQDFDRVGCSYGLASLTLRRACLMYGVRATSREKLSETNLENARVLLDNAYSAFEGNHTWQLITNAHRLILAILSSEQEAALRKAKSIRTRALQLENTQTLQLIATLLLRFGRLQVVHFARTDLALACWSCASILGEGYCLDIIQFVALNWETCLYDDFKNDLEAYISFKRTHNHFTQLIRRLDCLDVSEAESTASIKSTILLSYRHLASIVLNQIEDHTSLKEWNEQSRALIQDPLVGAYFQGVGDPIEGYDEDLAKFIIPPETLDNVETALEDWTITDAKYQHTTLALGDIAGAKAIIRDFIDRQKQNDAAQIYVRAAYRALGEFANMRSALGDHLDPNKVNFRTHAKLGHGESWSRSTSATEFHSASNCDNALAQCVMAHDWFRGEQMLNQFEHDVPDYLSFEVQKNDRGYRLGHAGIILERTQQPNLPRAFKLLVQARKLIIEAQAGTEDIDRQTTSADIIYISAFYQALARVCLKFKEQALTPQDPSFASLELPKFSSFEDLALFYLEDAKAKSVGQSLKSADGQLDESSQDQEREKRLARVLGAIPSKNRTSEEDEELVTLAQTKSIAQQILKPQPSEATQKDQCFLKDHIRQVAEDALLIVISYSGYGKVWFGITSNGVEIAGHDEDYKLLTARDYAITIQHRVKSTSHLGSWHGNSADLHEGLEYLANEMLSPFSTLLAAKKHIIFSVSFPMSSFPFGLLPYNSQPLFLSKAISITPSLAAFAQLHARQPHLKRNRVALVTRPATPAEYLRTEEKPLPQTAIEALAIAGLSPSPLKPTLSSTMTRDSLLSLLASNDIVHIGTHGDFDTRSPWLSSISLEKQLRVLDLAGVRSRCGLVVLAACASGLGKLSFTEEAIGFGHAVLSGCANSFLGSLWEVNDVGTMLLMVSFYRELWACEPGTVLAEVLRRAQVRLYRCDTAAKVREELDVLRESVGRAREMGIDVASIIKDPDSFFEAQATFSHGFSHPFYWASFVLMGNGAANVCDGDDDDS